MSYGHRSALRPIRPKPHVFILLLASDSILAIRVFRLVKIVVVHRRHLLPTIRGDLSPCAQLLARPLCQRRYIFGDGRPLMSQHQWRFIDGSTQCACQPSGARAGRRLVVGPQSRGGWRSRRRSGWRAPRRASPMDLVPTRLRSWPASGFARGLPHGRCLPAFLNLRRQSFAT